MTQVALRAEYRYTLRHLQVALCSIQDKVVVSSTRVDDIKPL